MTTTPVAPGPAAPCLKCKTTEGYTGRNVGRSARVQGLCTRCYDRKRYEALRPKRVRRPVHQDIQSSPRPTRRTDYHGPLDWLVAAFDRRDHKAILTDNDESEDAA